MNPTGATAISEEKVVTTATATPKTAAT